MSDLIDSPETPSSEGRERESAKAHSVLEASTNTVNTTSTNTTSFQTQDLDNQAPAQHHLFSGLSMESEGDLLGGQFGNLMSSPVFGNMNFLPTLSNGIFDLGSNPNTPQLPPLDAQLNSNLCSIDDVLPEAQSAAQSVPLSDPYLGSIGYALPAMPSVHGFDSNVPPPSDDISWQQFWCVHLCLSTFIALTVVGTKVHNL